MIKHPHIQLSTEVARAINIGLPLVALESTVITHG
ncbi:MAG TPA: pseudouridine-5-phosphate glycosidase, partial [Anaerolineae bacterium]|nr:pseudouridine-5-phosphate glycosidase [Anaerolineae bacterium]